MTGEVGMSPEEKQQLLHKHGSGRLRVGGAGDRDGASALGAFFNFMKANIGSGILAMPYAFSEGGTLLGSLLLVVVILVAAWCSHLLIEAKEADSAVDADTYGQLGKIGLGTWAQISIEILLVFCQVGCCCAYLIFVGTTLRHDFGIFPMPVWVALCMTVLIPAAWLPLKDVAFISLTANTTLLTALILIMVYAFRTITPATIDATSLAKWTFPFAIGTYLYTVEGVGVIVNLHETMKNPSRMFGVLRWGYVVVFVLVLLFGLSGYMAYAPRMTNGLIITLLPPGAMTTVINILVVFSLLLTFPVQLFPVLDLIDSHFFPETRSARTSARMRIDTLDSVTPGGSSSSSSGSAACARWRICQMTTRAITVALIGVVAMVIPHFSEFINLVGSFGGAMLGITFPALLHLALVSRDPRKRTLSSFHWFQAMDIFLAVVGTLVSVGCTTLALWRLIEVMRRTPILK